MAEIKRRRSRWPRKTRSKKENRKVHDCFAFFNFLKKYGESPLSNFIIPVFISNSGCPARCIFCDQGKTGGSAAAFPDVKSEISVWLERKGPARLKVEAAFYGGSFTGLPMKRQEQLLKNAHSFIESGDISSIRISTRPDRLSVKNLQLLKEYGVDTVEIGVQSMDSVVLEKSRRGYGVHDVKDAFSLLKEFGFRTGAQLMPGLPGDNRAKSLKTAESVVLLRPDFARIYPVLVIKGTALEELYNERKYRPLSVEEAVEWSCVMFRVLNEGGIDVIRMGLQATEMLDSGGVVAAGPYHPAFGQLVKSRLALRELLRFFKRGEDLPPGDIVVYVSPSDVSNFVGQKRENLVKLRNEIKRDVFIKPSTEIRPGEFSADGFSGSGFVRHLVKRC